MATIASLSLGNEDVNTELPAVVDVVPEFPRIDTEVEAWDNDISRSICCYDEISSVAKEVKDSLEEGGLDSMAASIASISVESIKRRLGINTSNPVLGVEAYSNELTRFEATSIATEGLGDFLLSIWEGIKTMIQKLVDLIKAYWKKYDESNSAPAERQKRNHEKIKEAQKAKQVSRQSNPTTIEQVRPKKTFVILPGLSGTVPGNKDEYTIKDMIEIVDSYRKLEGAAYEVLSNIDGAATMLLQFVEGLDKAPDFKEYINGLDVTTKFILTTPMSSVVDTTEVVVPNLLDKCEFVIASYAGNDDLKTRGYFAPVTTAVSVLPDREFIIPKDVHELESISREWDLLVKDYKHFDDLAKQVKEYKGAYRVYVKKMDEILKNNADARYAGIHEEIKRANAFMLKIVNHASSLVGLMLSRRNALGATVEKYVDVMAKELIKNNS